MEYALAIAITFLLSFFSYHFIELYFLKVRWIKALPAKLLVSLSIILIVTTAYINEYGMSSQQWNSLSVTTDKSIWSPYASIPTPTDQSLPLFGRKMYVVGDSHAGAYAKMLTEFSTETGIEIVVNSSAGCGITNLRKPVLTDESSCKNKAQNWIAQIKKYASHKDIVFLASLKTYRFVNQNSINPANIQEKLEGQFTEKAITMREAALNESLNIISELSQVTNNIVIDAPKPVFNYVGFRCADWYTENNPICGFGDSIDVEFFHRYRESTMASVKIIKERFDHILVWDPSVELCDAERCTLHRKKKPLFFDADHLSGYGNQVIYGSFKNAIKTYMPF